MNYLVERGSFSYKRMLGSEVFETLFLFVFILLRHSPISFDDEFVIFCGVVQGKRSSIWAWIW